MKPLKRYQYERYAVLCNLTYQRAFKQTRYGFDTNGQRIIRHQFGKIMVRVLWSQNNKEVIVVMLQALAYSAKYLALLAQHPR